jgi:hypothetical protein
VVLTILRKVLFSSSIIALSGHVTGLVDIASGFFNVVVIVVVVVFTTVDFAGVGVFKVERFRVEGALVVLNVLVAPLDVVARVVVPLEAPLGVTMGLGAGLVIVEPLNLVLVSSLDVLGTAAGLHGQGKVLFSVGVGFGGSITTTGFVVRSLHTFLLVLVVPTTISTGMMANSVLVLSTSIRQDMMWSAATLALQNFMAQAMPPWDGSPVAPRELGSKI